MNLSPRALVAPERCQLYLNMEDTDNLTQYINYASLGIESHCNRRLIRSQMTRIHNSYGDGTVMLLGDPVLEVVSLRHDPTRIFGDDTELTGYFLDVYNRKIILQSSTPIADSTIRLVTNEGYSLVIDPVPPIAPETDPTIPYPSPAFEGQSAYVVGIGGFIYTSGAWVAEEETQPVPEELEGVAAEYTAFLKTRFRTGFIGQISRERGYSFEGSAVAYEKIMPSHIKERLEPYVLVAV